MRYLFLIFTLLPFLGNGQDIPKGAETIQIITSLPDSLLLDKAVTFLNEEGYTVNRVDAKRGTLVTDSKSSSDAMSIRVLGTVKSGVLALKAQWSATAGGFTFTNEPVLYKGMVGSNLKKSFLALNKLATRFKDSETGASIAYIKP